MKNPPQKRKKSVTVPKRLRGDTAPEIRNNPFELKINREKFSVLGRSKKHTVGLPGVSRSRAIQKRKETLLKEFRLKDKNNKFIDRRFAEYDSKITPEEKILQRFTIERQRGHDKKNVFNLNEDEELTHFGQTLAELEKLPEAQESESDEDERGLLSAELTETHFGGGGGLLRRKSSEEQEDGEKRARSRQQLIEEMILRSKQSKRERQAERSEAQELTEKLDQDWRSIHSLLSHNPPRMDPAERPVLEDYDVMVRELGFEMKAQPSEKLKSAEEVAREERQRLQDLEVDRLRRMMGDSEEAGEKHTHISADDINDGFLLDGDQRNTLIYKDGKWNVEGVEEKDEEEQVDDEEAEEEEEEEAAAHGDLESDKDSEEEEAAAAADEEVEQQAGEDVEERKTEAQEAARAELPYTFTAPESYEELRSLLGGRSSEQTRIVLERTIKSNHPNLSSRSRATLQKLFGFLLEHVSLLCARSPPDLQTVDALVPGMQALSQLFPEEAAAALQTRISDTAHALDETLEVRGRAPMPELDTLVLLKVTLLLFPSSDFRHPVCTPALLLIGQMLSKCAVLTLQDVCKGLFLCALALESVSLSRRFFPELVNFLSGMLHLAVPDKPRAGYSVVSPFRQQGRGCDLLLLTNGDAALGWRRLRLRLQTLGCSPEEKSTVEADHCRLSVLDSALDLLRRTTLLYGDLPSFSHILQPIRALLQLLPAATYPDSIKDLHREALEALPAAPSQNAPLVFRKQKPIALKLHTPKIVQIQEYGKKCGNSREQREHERLKYRVKREFKGALREIRKDRRFLAEEKLKDIMSRDSERRRKVKELFGSLATQEGEWKALKRSKRK